MATGHPTLDRYIGNPLIPWGTRTAVERFAGVDAGAGGGMGSAGAGGTPAPGTLPGAPSFGYVGAYGGIPQVPSPGTSQGAAIGANTGNLPALLDLATQTNQFSNQQALAGLQANLPGYDAMTAQASQNIAGNLAGSVPADVWRNIQQMAAERGTAIGSPGSPNAEAGLLRSLGLTTLDLQNLGQTQLSGAVARTPVGQQFNPASMFLSPEQWQEAQMAANLYASAPVPALKAQADLAALRSGVGAGRGATAPSGGGYGYTLTPVGATAPQAGMPQAPQYRAPTSPSVAPGRSYDPNAYSSSNLTESVFSPYSIGGYDYNQGDLSSGAEVPPEIAQWAAPLMDQGGDMADDYWWNFGQYE